LFPGHDHDADYEALRIAIQNSFAAATAMGENLFATDLAGTSALFNTFLASLPGEQQLHSCTACRRFFKDYAHLVTIGQDGSLTPVMWGSPVPLFYMKAADLLAEQVRTAKVTSPSMSSARTWGIPETGTWTHFYVQPRASQVFRGNRALTDRQTMAAARESFRTVAQALADFSQPTMAEALRILENETLHRSERFIAPVRWLLELKQARRDAGSLRMRDNILWRAVAMAPEGYLHPRASMIGSLLEDLEAAKPLHEVIRSFNAKVGPLDYQRPKAPPTVGNLAQAEALVTRMGVAPSLERRFARLDECETIWTPAPERPAAPVGEVFGHLKPAKMKRPVPRSLPRQTMTWAKFADRVLSTAERIDFLIPHTGAFIGLATAVHADAPPILKWDRAGARNPVSWFCYPAGSQAVQWGLTPAAWVPVTAAVPLPTLWGDQPKPHLGAGIVLVLEGAVDSQDSGNALFPEFLAEDLHPVRATIEAYSRSATLSGRNKASACGYDLRAGRTYTHCILRVYSGGDWAEYQIDRWD
jgi:hypothetical protein